ncbi:hypothetical protein [Herpetosiphon sp. NSE202]|uniref:hypothetical protein n=1 Tax=Herpetosiphon sp. NSE202 TaxID=3351349 RepID=UPI0036418B9D
MQKVYRMLLLGGLIALLSNCQAAQQSPTTPTVSATPNGASLGGAGVDLGGNHVLFIDSDRYMFLWDGRKPLKARGTAHDSVDISYALTLDPEREVVIIQYTYQLEARSLRDNQRLWQLPIISRQAQFETTILDVINDPFNELVWLIEKQATNDPFQPATVRLRGLDSRSGLALRQLETPLVNAYPSLLPTAYGLWLLADGQLLPFDQDQARFGEARLSGVEFVQVAADGKRVLALSNGIITELDLATKQILKQTTLEAMPKRNRLGQMLVSADLSYVVLIGLEHSSSSNLEQIMAYDREGKIVGSWERKLLVDGYDGSEPGSQFYLQFLDEHRLLMLESTGNLDFFDLRTGKSNQFLATSDRLDGEQFAQFDGFIVIPKLDLLPAFFQPELAAVADAALSQPETKLIGPVPAPQPLLLRWLGSEYRQIKTDGTYTSIVDPFRHTIARSNAPPLILAVQDFGIDLYDPTNQTTITLNLGTNERCCLDYFGAVSASDNQSVVICTRYYAEPKADSRVKRCLALDLQTGQTSDFGEMPTAPNLIIPMYWDGRQLTMAGIIDPDSDQAYGLWQTLAEDRSQTQRLLNTAEIKQLWYKLGSPTIIYQDLNYQLYSYAIESQQRQLLLATNPNHTLKLEIAPNGERVMVFEQQLPFSYGVARMIDARTGLELWRDPMAQNYQGHWSGDSQWYLIHHEQIVNSSLAMIDAQGQARELIQVAQPLSWARSDWSARHVVLQVANTLALLRRDKLGWQHLSTIANYRISPLNIVYIYPQP